MPHQQHLMRSPYVGRTISLISRLDIRYEGTLVNIDNHKFTIALANVHAWGTEDRASVDLQVTPRDEIYEYVLFKAHDIKDVILPELNPKPRTDTNLAYDPAILSVTTSPPPLSSVVVNAMNVARARGGDDGNVRRGLSSAEHAREMARLQKDFDFEKANEKFKKTLAELEKKDDEKNKDKNKKKDETEKKEAEKKTFYNKSESFFDSISCETIEKQKGTVPKANWRQTRETNEATFGPQAVRAFFRRFHQPAFSYEASTSRGRGGYRGNYNRRR